jgi:hypothetical protein
LKGLGVGLLQGGLCARFQLHINEQDEHGHLTTSV